MVQSTTSAYLAVATDIAARQNATAAQADVKSATAYYLANIGKVTSAGQLVGDPRLFSYAMKAYGLGDMVYAKGLMLKVLNGGAADPKALSNTLSDPRYKAFAAAFDFAGQGTKATAATAATSGAAAKYIEQSLEDDQAKSNQGVADALYFKRNAPSVTSVYGLLADPTMLGVVETAYGISSTLGLTDIDTQASVLGKVVNLKDFQDPAKVEKLVERYTAAYDAQGSAIVGDVLLADTSNAAGTILDAANGTGRAVSPGSVLNLFDSTSPGQGGVSSSLLLSIAKLPKGG